MLERVGVERFTGLERDELCRHRGGSDIDAKRELTGMFGYFGEESLAVDSGVRDSTEQLLA